MHDPNLMSGIDDGEQVRQDVNKVTEEAVKRVQAGSAKAAKIQWEIKKDKAINNKFAKFLEYILKTIKSDEMISAVYNTFFMITNPKTWVKYTKKKINDVVVVWFFAPFFWDKIVEYKLDQYYADICPSWELNLNTYMKYIRDLSKKHHDNIPIDKSSLLNLLYNIIKEFKLSNSSNSDEKQITKEITAALHW